MKKRVTVEIDGRVVTGEAGEIAELLSAVASDEAFYFSGTKGLLKIGDMATNHIRNALLKLTREWASNLSGFAGLELLDMMANPQSFKEIGDLYKEYFTRVEKGE